MSGSLQLRRQTKTSLWAGFSALRKSKCGMADIFIDTDFAPPNCQPSNFTPRAIRTPERLFFFNWFGRVPLRDLGAPARRCPSRPSSAGRYAIQASNSHHILKDALEAICVDIHDYHISAMSQLLACVMFIIFYVVEHARS